MVRTYDPKSIAVVVGGVAMGGFADGTSVSVERDEDSFSATSGNDSVVSRSKSSNKMGKITITLAQTSPSNDVLSGFFNTDEATNSGIVPALVKDNSGRSMFAALNAWIVRPAPSAFSKEIENREWVLQCADLNVFVGGNADFEG